MGRLLITLELCERNVLPAPLLYLSAFFEATHVDYYNGLRGISEKGDWPGWLHYFLNAAARQAEDAVSRAERINGLLARWRNEVSGDVHAKVALRIVDMLGGNPFVAPRGAEKYLGMAYNTVMRAIRQLEKHGIIKEVSGAKRDRAYCARTLLDILEEPARLSPAERF